ncbi:uncharacterized protein LOC109713836 [Ananas comosus]|uniref:Uncharacterized protein LOC109713836 n=1 Tax=Ananas comosus TaxID=4615 RepID=A0A6P5FCH5_ANACO|nr:uncharacterized protein LOC109713836 [Ananas comosus]XP_020093658.1 uncharacterized protein LOC109713836 [Ananas comosus]XP_020093659.1 uncharacterized protein LOC109713836 [Ananas comosus]
MARDPHPIPRPWFLDVVPLLVVVLIAAHVLALAYWIYRLATDRQTQSQQPQRSKAH